MTRDEYIAWVKSLGQAEQLCTEQVNDAIHQRLLFDARREAIEKDYGGLAVGMVGDELIYDSSVTSLLDKARSNYPGRMMYFEPVGYRAF